MTLVQAVDEMTPFAALCVEARDRGIQAVRSTRDANSHTFSLYLDAAITTNFLRSSVGQEQLRAADTCSRRLMMAAVANHNDSMSGTTTCNGWALIRKLHPTGPSALHLWGRHPPPANSDRAYPSPF